MLVIGLTTLKCLCQRGYNFSYIFKWGLWITKLFCSVDKILPYLSQSTAFIMQKNNLCATSIVCLCYLSSLATRN